MEIISMEVGYLDVVESVIENKFLKLSLEFDQVMFEHAENLADLNSLYLTEDSTEDDIYHAFLEEVKKTTEKSKGILSSIISAVRTFFKKIRESAMSKNIDLDSLPDKFEVGCDPKKLQSTGKETNNLINKFLSGDKSVMKSPIVAIGAILGASVIAKEAISPTLNNLKEFSDETDKVLGRAQDAVNSDNLNPEEQTWLKSAITKLKDCGAQATKIIKQIPKMNTQEYKDIAKKNREERKEKSVFHRAFKKTKEAISSSTKDAVNANAETTKTNAKENIKINEMSFPELDKRLGKIDHEISIANDQLDRLNKEKNKKLGGIASLRRRVKQLQDKGDRKSPEERREYDEKSEQLAEIEARTTKGISDLEKKLDKLKKEKKLVEKNILARKKESDKSVSKKAGAIYNQILHGED